MREYPWDSSLYSNKLLFFCLFGVVIVSSKETENQRKKTVNFLKSYIKESKFVKKKKIYMNKGKENIKEMKPGNFAMT